MNYFTSSRKFQETLLRYFEDRHPKRARCYRFTCLPKLANITQDIPWTALLHLHSRSDAEHHHGPPTASCCRNSHSPTNVLHLKMMT